MQSKGDTFYGNQSSSGTKIIYLKDTKGPMVAEDIHSRIRKIYKPIALKVSKRGLKMYKFTLKIVLSLKVLWGLNNVCKGNR